MLNQVKLLPVALIIVGILCSGAEGGTMNAASGSLFSVNDTEGLSAGGRIGLDKREIVIDDRVEDLDVEYYVVRLGRSILPFAAVYAEAGTSMADGPSGEGERGFAWGLGAELNVLEYVFEYSPVFGDVSRLGFQLTGTYRSMESNLSDADFELSEVSVRPLAYYAVNYRPEVKLDDYNPDGAALHGGLVFNSLDGELGPEDIAENRDFGFLLGFSLRFAGRWMTELSGTFFDGDDVKYSMGLLHRF
jgi:hypothetical protein